MLYPQGNKKVTHTPFMCTRVLIACKCSQLNVLYVKCTWYRAQACSIRFMAKSRTRNGANYPPPSVLRPPPLPPAPARASSKGTDCYNHCPETENDLYLTLSPRRRRWSRWSILSAIVGGVVVVDSNPDSSDICFIALVPVMNISRVCAHIRVSRYQPYQQFHLPSPCVLSRSLVRATRLGCIV